ncbi:hypothetical protein AAG906_003831 [Vitis piasezkii]
MDLGDTLGVSAYHLLFVLFGCGVESPCSHGSAIFDIAHTGVSITSGDIEGHILSFHSVYLPQDHDQR